MRVSRISSPRLTCQTYLQPSLRCSVPLQPLYVSILAASSTAERNAMSHFRRSQSLASRFSAAPSHCSAQALLLSCLVWWADWQGAGQTRRCVDLPTLRDDSRHGARGARGSTLLTLSRRVQTIDMRVVGARTIVN